MSQLFDKQGGFLKLGEQPWGLTVRAYMIY